MSEKKEQPKYPGIRITTNGNQITDGGVFFPITPSTEMGESYQRSFAEGKRTVNFTSGRNIRLE